MFGTKHNECVGFESRWKVTRVFSEHSCQTDKVSNAEKEISTNSKNTIEIQTDEPENHSNVNVDMQKLASWLDKSYPIIKKELDEANNSQAFKGYRLSDDIQGTTCKLLQSIELLEQDSDKIYKVSGLSWNKTGKYLAVIGCQKHNAWCYHRGFVLIYTVSRDEKISDTTAKKLTTESCVTNIEFHPTLPAVLATATFSGNIALWDIHNNVENSLVTLSDSHEYPINRLSWIQDDSVKSSILATSSNDGLLKLWSLNTTTLSLALKARYKMKIPILTNSDSNRIGIASISDIERGVVCFDFSKRSPNVFVAALEGGLIVECSTLGASELKGHSASEPLYDPVYKYYEKHKGEVISIKFSPNGNDMFVSSGNDAEIRVYLIGQEDPAQIIFPKTPLFDVSFVPNEEQLVFGCGSEGLPEIFNLISGKSVKLQTEDKVKFHQINSLAIHSKWADVLALGTSNGELQVWNIPWHLLSKQYS